MRMLGDGGECGLWSWLKSGTRKIRNENAREEKKAVKNNFPSIKVNKV